MILSGCYVAGSMIVGLSPGCLREALLAEKDDEAGGDDDRGADRACAVSGTSPKKTKPKITAQTISEYW